MIAATLLLMAQAAPADTPRSWSVLAPPCPTGEAGDVVVCAPALLYRMPLPDERGPPDHARRPTGDPRAALDNAAPPCPPRGCMGPGPDLIAVGARLVDEIAYAARRKHPGKREPIPLD